MFAFRVCVVILSVAIDSQREPIAESKDPYESRAASNQQY